MGLGTNDQDAGIRWTNSPLRHALDQLTEYSQAHAFRNGGSAIGNNQATRLVVGAAETLAAIVTGIRDGLRDGMGYEL